MRRERNHMKSQIFVALFIVAIQLIPSGCSHGDTEYIPPVRATVFVSSDEAWVLTRKGVLKRISTDGQSIKVADAQQRVQGMTFVSPFQGWVVDSDWNVWQFDGVNWTFVGHNDDNKSGLIWPSSVSFVDEKVGWALTTGPLFLTDDGGRTWKKVPRPPEMWASIQLFVIDRETAYLHGEKGEVRRTADRGKTWKSFDLGLAGDVTSFACRDGGGECWAGTSHGNVFAIKGEASPKRVPFPTPKEMTITYICPFGESGLLVSGFTLVRDGNPRPRGVLLTTSDEGATWKTVDVPQDDGFEQVASFGNTIWLASHTAIYRSSDDGGSWVKIYDATDIHPK